MKVGAWKLPVRGPGAVQALRMTAASLAAFGLATALALPQGFWAVITALIVTQSNVGGSLKAAFDRFAGSVCGAVYGGAVAFLIPHATPLLRAAALVVAVGPLSLLAAASAGFRVAPITAIIVLLGTSGATLGPFGFALDRILEVGLGCVVGLLASVLVVPARASLTVLAHARRIARLLAEQMETLAEPGSIGATGGGALATSIRKGLTGLETLIGEAARERRSRLVRGPDLAPLLRTLLRLRHDLVMLRRAAGSPWDAAVRDRLAPPWTQAAIAGAARLRDLGQALAHGQPPAADPALAENVATYRAALDGVLRQDGRHGLEPEELGRLFGLAFGLDQLRRDLDDLAARASELAAARDGEG